MSCGVDKKDLDYFLGHWGSVGYPEDGEGTWNHHRTPQAAVSGGVGGFGVQGRSMSAQGGPGRGAGTEWCLRRHWGESEVSAGV